MVGSIGNLILVEEVMLGYHIEVNYVTLGNPFITTVVPSFHSNYLVRFCEF